MKPMNRSAPPGEAEKGRSGGADSWYRHGQIKTAARSNGLPVVTRRYSNAYWPNYARTDEAGQSPVGGVTSNLVHGGEFRI